MLARTTVAVLAITLCSGGQVQGDAGNHPLKRAHVDIADKLFSRRSSHVGLATSVPEGSRYEEGWDHSRATYITDFVIVATCLVSKAMAYFERRKLSDEVARWMLLVFMAYAELAGDSLLFGGIAHYLIDRYHVLGLAWGSANSGWMYFWLSGVVLLPWSVAAGLAVVPACLGMGLTTVGARRRSALGIYGVLTVVATMVSAVELYLVAAEQWAFSGLATGLMSLASCSVGAISAGVTPGLPGTCFLMSAFALWFTGFAMAMFKPASCTDPLLVYTCPFDPHFNHNAICHVFYTIGVVLLFVGVRRAARWSQEHGGKPVDEDYKRLRKGAALIEA